MLHINELTYRIEGRAIFDRASAGVPAGHKVGLVGRNGAGKTTLLRLITEEIAPDDGAITRPKSDRVGYVAQEAPGGEDTLIAWVLAADTERARLLAEVETATDPQRISDIHERLIDIGAHAAPARAAQILAGLGFDEAAQNQPCRVYSGGWRMRVALAAVLFLEPELLLLDEPTNYLDLEGTMWLESYLRAYPHTVIMVSHDRNLLNRAVSSILHLDRSKLTFYAGGYDAFEDTRREQQRLEAKLKKKQDAERAHIQAFIDRFRAKATKATQAQSRIKALARMQPIAAQFDDRVVPFAFPAPAKPLASPLIQLENGVAGYGEDAPVLCRLNLRIDNDDRIALLGQNGNGKSTFAKLISGRLAPRGGMLHAHNQLKIGYFAQHQLDELVGTRTPFDYLSELMPEASEAQRRARLGAAGFGVERANNLCNTLSGGEKARLLLMLATFDAPHLLILDEPTNHLDIDSREALVQALNAFEGAIIMISHDRHLVDACADRLWVVRDGTVASFDGDIDGYQRQLLADRGGGQGRTSQGRTSQDRGGHDRGGHDRGGQGRNGKDGNRVGNTNGERQSRVDERRAAAELRARIAPLRKAVQAAEVEVDRLARQIARIDGDLANPQLFQNAPDKAQALAVERGRLAKALTSAEDDWLAATEAYEAARSAASS